MSLTFAKIKEEIKSRKLEDLPLLLKQTLKTGRSIEYLLIGFFECSVIKREKMVLSEIGTYHIASTTEDSMGEYEILPSKKKEIVVYEAVFEIDGEEKGLYCKPEMLFKDVNHAQSWGKRHSRIFVRLLHERPFRIF